MKNNESTALKRFDLPYPQTCGEHAECSHLLSFLSQYVNEVYGGATTIQQLKTDIDVARFELEDALGECLDRHYESNPF